MLPMWTVAEPWEMQMCSDMYLRRLSMASVGL